MRLRETLHFSPSEYRDRIASRDYTYAELACDIYVKRRAIMSSKASAAVSIACVGVSGGMSLAGTAWFGRNLVVENNKLALLEAEWARRGQDPLPQWLLKDTLIPVMLTTTIDVFMYNVDVVISHATATAHAAQAAGMPGYVYNGHPIGAFYTTIEKGLVSAGKMASEKYSASEKTAPP